jgi:hypothetical protein
VKTPDEGLAVTMGNLLGFGQHGTTLWPGRLEVARLDQAEVLETFG